VLLGQILGFGDFVPQEEKGKEPDYLRCKSFEIDGTGKGEGEPHYAF